MSTDPGHRLQWGDLPPAVRTEIETRLGAAVVVAAGQAGGYSPSLAARCRLSDGRRVFIKAVSSDQNPQSPVMLRAEMAATAALPDDVPAPRLLDALDDGLWVAAVFEDIDGRLPHVPWDRSELQRVLAAVERLGTIPFDAAGHVDAVPPMAARFGPIFGNWRAIAGESGSVPDGAWWAPWLERLAAMEDGWLDALAGSDLLHGDIRSD